MHNRLPARNRNWLCLPTLVPAQTTLSFEADAIHTAGLVALLAHSRKADRAVANSLRNFLRTMGGSVGLTS
jgi:hypothetical protein